MRNQHADFIEGLVLLISLIAGLAAGFYIVVPFVVPDGMLLAQFLIGLQSGFFIGFTLTLMFYPVVMGILAVAAR